MTKGVLSLIHSVGKVIPEMNSNISHYNESLTLVGWVHYIFISFSLVLSLIVCMVHSISLLTSADVVMCSMHRRKPQGTQREGIQWKTDRNVWRMLRNGRYTTAQK